MLPPEDHMDRRRLLRAGALLTGGAALSALMPGWARSQTSGSVRPPGLSGAQIDLTIV